MSSSAPAAAAFKDLCIDAVDAGAAARFWAPALGLRATVRASGYLLSDDVQEHRVWVNAVTEPKSAKLRVHLDVYVAAVSELTALGATVLQDQQRWTVLADPEGAELCAFVRPPDEVPDYRLYELVVDAADPERLALWWGARFGVALDADPEDESWALEGAPSPPWPVVFGAVPEPKTEKNRVHWDVWGDARELTAAGATLLRQRDDEIAWDVLADPEGNEFCVFARPE